MRRRGFALFIVVGILAAACGSGDAGSSGTTIIPAGTATSTTEATPATPGATSDAASPSTTAPPAPAPDPNRELAPDFDLQLGSGELYQLSTETKPVYLVFWAEW